METQAIFENITENIQQEIKKAERTIFIAVAWFTNKTIFEELVTKANEGCTVHLMLSNDKINIDSSIEFDRLNVGTSKVYFVGDGEKELMHNKFCIIDGNTVITGSFNWSFKAEKNFENIVLTSGDQSLAEQFIIEFNNIKKQYFPNEQEPIQDMPIDKIVRRLEIIKNYILLEDTEEVETVSNKLKEYLFNYELKSIIDFISDGKLSEAVSIIEKFITRQHQISVWVDPEISVLKLEIKILENQLVSLEYEKTELDRVLSDFHRRHTIELGETILKILELRKLKFKDDDKKFYEADQDEKEYRNQFDIENKKEIYTLSVEDEEILKKKFRKAMLLCHPDKFTNESLELQVKAEEISIELIQAKEKKDFKRVVEILQNLEKGILTASSIEKISDVDILSATVERLRSKIYGIEKVMQNIKKSEEYQTIIAIEDWNVYFEEMKERLKIELEFLRVDLI